MAIQFPTNPILNQSYTNGDKSWYWDGVGWRVVPLVNSSILTGTKNKLINGEMLFSYRGTSISCPISSNTYTADRWFVGNGCSAVLNYTQSTDVPAGGEFQNSAALAVTTADTSIAAGDYMYYSQIIEGYNARPLVGKYFTLSFNVKSPKAGIHCVSVRNSGGDRSYVLEYTVNQANIWEKKSLIFPGLILDGVWNWINGLGAGIRFALAAGTTFQAAPGVWQAGNYLATANQVNLLDTVGNTFTVTGLQLELGTVATDFEHRIYSQELSFCQRYLPVFYGSDMATGFSESTTSTLIAIPFPAVARIPPGGLTAISPTSLKVYNTAGAAITATGVNFVLGGFKSCMVEIVTAGSMTVGQGNILNANGGTILFNGCEL